MMELWVIKGERGGGDKKAKIQGRTYEIIEIPGKFLGGW